MQKPKVLLIAGAAHGGTTITGLIVGQHAQMFVTGKLRDFPGGSLFDADNRCSCGAPAAECSFWREVRSRYLPYEAQPEKEKLPHLYQLISDISGRQYIVDITHDFGDFERLSGIPGIDLRLLHVVRNGQAVVYSRLRKDYRLGDIRNTGWKHTRRVIQASRRWHEAKARFTRAERELGPQRALRISYEKLCQDPVSTLRDVGKLLELDFSSIGERIAAGQPLAGMPHLLRGNARLRAQKEVRLRFDEAYRSEMPRLDRLSFRLVSVFQSFFR